MRRLSLRVFPIALAALAAPSAALAGPGWLGNAGAFGAYFFGDGGDQAGGGVEFSAVRYNTTITRDAFCFGPLAQVGGMVRDREGTFYGMLGAEVAYGGLGIEAGVYGQTAGGGYGASLGLHLAPYLSLGYSWVSIGVHVPVAQGDALQTLGLQGVVVVGFKVPFLLAGDDPRERMFSMPSGRPLVYAGAPVVAPRASGPAWIDDLSPEVNSLDARTREALASAWLDDAYAEHASIAAFTRVAMQLLAVGAPPELIEGAHRAALDEVRHAKLCFTLASMYGARWEAPGALSPDAIRHAVCDLPAIAREALLEGCLGEGVAAAMARASRDTAEDPEVLGVLDAIADDESRHCALAWDILAWCLETGGAPVADAVADALRALAAAEFALDLPQGIDAATWAACGRVDPRAAEVLHEAVARGVAERAWRHPAMGGRVQAISPRRGAPRARKGR